MGRNPNAPTARYFIPGPAWHGRNSFTAYYKLVDGGVWYSDDKYARWTLVWKQVDRDIFHYVNHCILEEVPECTLPQDVKERENVGT